jgi:hypothetical protein
MQPMQPMAQYPVPGTQQVAPVYIPQGQPQQGAYPAPGYPGYPANAAYPQANAAYAQANAPRQEPSWNAPLRAAPANSLTSELQDLESQRAISLTAGTVFRSRAGEAGLSQLSDFQLPVQARFPVGEGKIVVGVTPTVLDAGTPASNYATLSRFGGGPSAVYNSLFNQTTPGQQNASGVGLNVGYEGKNFDGGIGTTPLGFPTTNVVGNVTFKGSFGDSWNYKADISRRAVTDSVLSFAGAKDGRGDERWGGVVATGVRGDLGYDDGTYGVYSYLSAHGITGKNVASNSRVETGGGAYLHLLNSASSKLTLGMNIGLMGYEKNLSYYTYGQGGYFSPAELRERGLSGRLDRPRRPARVARERVAGRAVVHPEDVALLPDRPDAQRRCAACGKRGPATGGQQHDLQQHVPGQLEDRPGLQPGGRARVPAGAQDVPGRRAGLQQRAELPPVHRQRVPALHVRRLQHHRCAGLWQRKRHHAEPDDLALHAAALSA